MEAAELAGHVVAVSVLILVGVPTNAVVIWIHTRSKSHLTHNKFPLVFAAIDLVAVLFLLPLSATVGHGVELTSQVSVFLNKIYRVLSGWTPNAYCSTLLMASTDKLYAVTSPFDYKSKHDLFIKITVIWAGPIDLVLTSVSALGLVDDVMFSTTPLYLALFLLTFLTTILLYVIIVVRIIQSERSMRLKIQPSTVG